MRIDLNAEIHTKDGHRAGNVKSAIFDPRSNGITEFVVSTGGLLGHDVLVSREVLERASRDGDRLVVDLSKGELDRLEAYVAEDYVAPPAGWMAPEVYGFPNGGYLWPITGAQPSTPPTGETERGSRMPAIRKGMTLRDPSGAVIGTVEDVRVDEASGALQGLAIRQAGTLERIMGGGEVIIVPAERVDLSGGDLCLLPEEEREKRAT